jgi:peroxiredoxin
MARTPSNEFKIGEKAPAFNLVNVVDNKIYSLDNLKGQKGTVIMFICNHCPFVVHINHELVAMANDYQKRGIKFIAISSNDVDNYPDDSPELMKLNADKNNFQFPYLYDEDQKVAKEFDAACTPDIYLFDDELNCHYHGQIDDSRPGNGLPVTGKDLREAMDLLLIGVPFNKIMHPSIGCNIKWKAALTN